jgi:hypothetical protein
MTIRNDQMKLVRRIKSSMDSGAGLNDILRDPRDPLEKIRNQVSHGHIVTGSEDKSMRIF